MNKPVKGGYTDRPAAEDDFKIERYIIGLTDFIKPAILRSLWQFKAIGAQARQALCLWSMTA